MERLELPCEDTQIAFAESFGFTSGYNAVSDLMKQMHEKPEVIVVSSDDIALGVLKGLRDLDLRVPEDVQVIGFDNIAFAKHFTPSLTTVAQDRKMLGEMAAKILIKLMDGTEEHISEITKLPVELIIRDSTKVNR